MYFARIKKFVMDFISPIPTQKKIHLILNILWLVLAVTCFIVGIILGITINLYDTDSLGLRVLGIWYVLSLVCIIPFLPTFLKRLIRSIRGAVFLGKAAKYSTTTTSEVTPLSGIYEVRRETKNLGGVFGLAWGIIYTIFLMMLFVFIGIAFLTSRFVLTTKEITRYIASTNTNKNTYANV